MLDTGNRRQKWSWNIGHMKAEKSPGIYNDTWVLLSTLLRTIAEGFMRKYGGSCKLHLTSGRVSWEVTFEPLMILKMMHIVLYCREPAWGIPPVTRSCGRKPDKTQGRVRLRGFPLEIPEHSPPKTRICLLYYVMLSTYSSVINRGLSPHHFSGKN